MSRQGDKLSINDNTGEKKRDQRANMSSQKKRRLNEKRRQHYAHKTKKRSDTSAHFLHRSNIELIKTTFLQKRSAHPLHPLWHITPTLLVANAVSRAKKTYVKKCYKVCRSIATADRQGYSTEKARVKELGMVHSQSCKNAFSFTNKPWVDFVKQFSR